MSRPVQLLVALAALAVIGWVAWQAVGELRRPAREEAARDRAECNLAESDLDRFETTGLLPAGVDTERLRLFVSICRSRRALGEL